MKTYYPNNPQHERAAWMLATMSPDMIAGIIALVTARGSGVISDLEGEEGPPRPLAIFSKDFIADADFAGTAMGFMVMVLAAVKTIKPDANFYQRVISEAYSLPTEMARGIAQKIETKDVFSIPTGVTDQNALDYMKRVQQQVQKEFSGIKGLFKGPGAIVQAMQNQVPDLDFLYELKLLGQAADELQSRARLMKGEALINAAMGMLPTVGDPGEGVYGDVYGDPDVTSALALIDTVKPLMGNPLISMILGGANKTSLLGQLLSKIKLGKLLGLGGGAEMSPGVATAVQQMDTPNANPVYATASHGLSVDDTKRILEIIQGAGAADSSTGDAYQRILSTYGDVAADAWKAGDVPGVMKNIVDLAAQERTTGYPDIDDQIIGDVEHEMASDGEDGSEMGGLFKRARSAAKQAKAGRVARRTARRSAKQNRKDASQNELLESKQAVTDASPSFAESQAYVPQSPASPGYGTLPPGFGGYQPGLTGYDESSMSVQNPLDFGYGAQDDWWI
jgi:predicted GNAT family N-acyltransferase